MGYKKGNASRRVKSGAGTRADSAGYRRRSGPLRPRREIPLPQRAASMQYQVPSLLAAARVRSAPYQIPGERLQFRLPGNSNGSLLPTYPFQHRQTDHVRHSKRISPLHRSSAPDRTPTQATPLVAQAISSCLTNKKGITIVTSG